MTLAGKIIKGTKTVYQNSVTDACALSREARERGLPEGGRSGPERPFRDKLECCLLYLCRDADISVPMWLSANSREFGRFGKTSFHADQFNERVNFDRFEIKLTED